MTLVKCPNNHFYDAARFGNNCPHCGMSTNTVDGNQTTVPLTEKLPVPPMPDQGNNDVTQPLTNPVFSQPSAPVNTPRPTEVQPGQMYPGNSDKTVDGDKTMPVTADMLGSTAVSKPAVVGWLVCTEGVNKGTDYRLHQGRNFIGRSVEMDVCLFGDNTVSRSSHAVVVYDPRGNVYMAQPGDSKELLYVNDALVLTPIALKAMDILSVGETKLMFVPLCGESFHW